MKIITQSAWRNLHKSGVKSLTLSLLMAPAAIAQQASQGNTTIFSGAEMTFFGDHNFISGGAGTMPGIINTERMAIYGVLNYSSASLNVAGPDNSNHVDGYVRNLGAGAFTYPVGDNGAYRPFAANGAGTTGAYFGVDPNVAITSKQGGGSYAELPVGTTFPTSDKAATLQTVSTVEYWDIDGANSSAITLTWNAASDVATLTGSNLLLLTIVGWNPTTQEWEEVPSITDATSLLGATSSLSAGSITTSSNVTPSNWTVYTLGAKVDPLPVVLTHFDAVKEGGTTLLNWATTQEANSSHFEVERSQNGKTWSSIGRVTSFGESTALQNYQFTDMAPLKGDNLYRLNMVDLDKSFAYSRIRSIYFEGGASDLAVFPNPASDHITISEASQINRFFMIDSRGNKVISDNAKLDQQGRVKTDHLAPGIYAIQLMRQDGSQSTHQVIITQ